MTAENTTPSLPRRDAYLYASGSFAGNLASRVVAAWLFYFYAAEGADADVSRRIPVWVVGVILTVTSVIEAFDDPLIGYWSDRTRSRWGRRIPFILLATPPWALCFLLLWTPPDSGESAGNAIYLFAFLLLYHTFGTLSGGPFESLLPEIAPHNQDRVRIVTVQVLFGTIAAAMALVGAGLVIDAVGFSAMAGIVAVLCLTSRYLALAGAWRHARRDIEPARPGVFRAFRSTLRNDQFLYFLPSFILFNTGITLFTAALPFFVEAVLRPPEDRVGTYTALLTAAPIAVVLLSLPVVQRLALTRGKAWVYSRAMLMGALYLPWIFFLGLVPGVPGLLQGILFAAPIGLAMTGVFVFPNALMADIIDYDALRTNMRREAMYYGAQNVIEKIVVALHAAILAGLLALGSSPDNQLGVRLVGPVAGAGILVGYLVFRGYRLPDSVSPATVRPLSGDPQSSDIPPAGSTPRSPR